MGAVQCTSHPARPAPDISKKRVRGISKNRVEFALVTSNFESLKNPSFMFLTASETHINYKRIEEAIHYLEENFQRQPELDEVAEKVHLSPFHFQRIFTEWAGISPKRFLQFLTVDYLKDKLHQSRNLVEVAESAGLSSQSRVYDLFTTLEGVTPQEYKLHGSGIRVEYGIHSTPFGLCLIGVTERGICWLSFLQTDEDPRPEIEAMKEHWHNSVFHQDQMLTASFVDKIFHLPGTNTSGQASRICEGNQLSVKGMGGVIENSHGRSDHL